MGCGEFVVGYCFVGEEGSVYACSPNIFDTLSRSFIYFGDFIPSSILSSFLLDSVSEDQRELYSVWGKIAELAS